MLQLVRLTSIFAYLLAALFACGMAPFSLAKSPKTCTTAEARHARYEASHLEHWDKAYESFKRFGRCDQGQVAEEYSYAVGRLLAYDWNQVELLLHFSAEDQEFKEFVLRHIDENIPEEETQLIIRNAQQRCPSDGDWLSKSIVDY